LGLCDTLQVLHIQWGKKGPCNVRWHWSVFGGNMPRCSAPYSIGKKGDLAIWDGTDLSLGLCATLQCPIFSRERRGPCNLRWQWPVFGVMCHVAVPHFQ
jgi:hypothetical protein